MAEVLITKELLVDFERGLQSSTSEEGLRNRVMDDLDELGDMGFTTNENPFGSRRKSSRW
jgi:hypothetical protein